VNIFGTVRSAKLEIPAVVAYIDIFPVLCPFNLQNDVR
jgi:hypothetical protein